jgi:hypothetical protein
MPSGISVRVLPRSSCVRAEVRRLGVPTLADFNRFTPLTRHLCPRYPIGLLVYLLLYASTHLWRVELPRH